MARLDFGHGYANIALFITNTFEIKLEISYKLFVLLIVNYLGAFKNAAICQIICCILEINPQNDPLVLPMHQIL